MASPSSSPSLRLPALSHKRRRRVLSSAAAAATTTPFSPSTDIVFEILSWLPTKSLGRCRCVSKNWRDLISSPAFIATRGTRAEPLLVAMANGSQPRSLQLMDTDGNVVKAVSLASAWTFGASLDGLACVTFRYNNYLTHAVVDLATEVTLTNLHKQPAVAYYMSAYIGLGRTAQSGVYKLLRLSLPWAQTWEVLTVGDDTEWRQTRPSPKIICQSYASRAVALDGALHFLTHGENCVLRFDLESEEWKVIHGPQGGVIRIGEPRSIAELNGALCMAQMAPYVLNIWFLNDSASENNIWVKAYTIPTRRKVVTYVMPLRVLSSSEALLFYYYNHNARPKLKVYNPRSRRCTSVKTPTNLTGQIGLCSTHLDPR